VNPEKGMFLVMYLKGWVGSHYRLTNRYQRAYLAKMIGEAARFLLQDVNTSALPSNMADMVVLFTISARRMEEAGTLIDLKKGACRKELLTVCHQVLKERRRSEEEEREQQTAGGGTNQLSRALTVASVELAAKKGRTEVRPLTVGPTESAVKQGRPEVRTFTHKGRVAAIAVSAEEIQTTLGLFKRISTKVLPKFIETAATMLWKEENDYKERQCSTMSDANALPADFSREGSFVQQGPGGPFSCMAHSSTGTPARR